MSVFNWVERVSNVSAAELRRTRAANSDELKHFTDAAGVVSCSAVTCNYALAPLERGRYALEGFAEARIIQTCAVTLEDFEVELSEPIIVEFWPAKQIAATTEVEVEAVGEDDPEPYTDGRLDIGKVVYEVLVSAIAPFARKPGAELEQEDTDGAQVATGPISNNPFAVLSRLKRPPGDSV